MTAATPDLRTACVRARTVISICHEVWCEPAVGVPAVPSAMGMLEVGGRAYLVPQNSPTQCTVGMAVSCLAIVDEVGVVRMTGTLGAGLRSSDDGGFARALRDHRGCLVATGPLDQLLAYPLELTAMTLVGPGESVEQELDLAAVRDAEPDWVLAHGDQIIAHLDGSHPGELVDLAQGHGVRDASSVAVRHLTRDGAELACLTADGVTTLRIDFDPPVQDPAELWARLTPGQPVRDRPGTGVG